MDILDPVTDPWSAPERDRIERLCAAVSGDPAAAPDLAQETLLQAWRIRDRLTDPDGSSRWLDAVARNVCHRWRVEQARRRSREAAGAGPEVAYDELAEVLERDELVELLERALALLPAETRAVLVGRYVEERGLEDLASDLTVSPEAVSMRLVRGRARLREVLETELADEPLAQVWRERYGCTWRSTRLRCRGCGAARMEWRRDDARGQVELRCAHCGPEDISSAFKVDNPTFAPLIGSARRPSTVLGRMGAWAADYWPRALTGPVPCTACGRPVRAATYDRPEGREPGTRRGWQLTCLACGEELSMSLSGLVLALPEAQRLSRLRPRLTALPSRQGSVEGRPVLVVGYGDPVSGEKVEVAFDDATSRPLALR